MPATLARFTLLLLLAVVPLAAHAKVKLSLQERLPAACAAPGDVRFAAEPVSEKWLPKDAVALGTPYAWYSQVDGGASGMGILFGPLGALANDHAVQNRTREQAGALGDDGVLDPRDAFDLAAFPRGTDAGATLELAPFLHYFRAKKSPEVNRALVLDARCGAWAGRYTWHFAPVAPEVLAQVPTPEERAAWKTEVASAATKLFELMQRDAAGALPETEQANRSSWQLNPYFEAAMPYSLRGEFDGRVVLVGHGLPRKSTLKFQVHSRGMHVLAADQVTVDD